MLNALADPWRDATSVRALLEVALLGVTGGALGCWLVFYGLSYSAESMAHALFPGLVAAALIGVPILVGGAVGLVVAALAIAVAGRVPGVGRDTSVAIVVTTLFGLGAVLALAPDTPAGLQGLLFGDLLGVSDLDLALAGGLALAVVLALRLLHGPLLVVGFDRATARPLGVRAGLVDAALLLLLAAAILVAVQGLGNLLVVAVLIAPGATARRLTRRMVPMMVLAAALAVLGGVAGVYLSFYAGTAGGASVAGVLIALYVAASIVERVRRAGRPRPSLAAPPPAAS
jgi:ABC-type Mn2+/Zn2+ transport system permease subunit